MTVKDKKITDLDLSFLYGKQESEIVGVHEDEIEIWKRKLTQAKERKKIRFVSDWVWWNLNCSNSTKEMLSQKGLMPTALYSHNLIWDELGEFPPGLSVKTSLLERFEENCLFITRNTIYVLVGPGRQSDIDPKVFNGIHF